MWSGRDIREVRVRLLAARYERAGFRGRACEAASAAAGKGTTSLFAGLSSIHDVGRKNSHRCRGGDSLFGTAAHEITTPSMRTDSPIAPAGFSAVMMSEYGYAAFVLGCHCRTFYCRSEI